MRAWRWTVLGPLLFAATVLIFARDGGYINRALSTRLPVYIGALSYSIYMVHVFVQERMANVLNILASSLQVLDVALEKILQLIKGHFTL